MENLNLKRQKKALLSILLLGISFSVHAQNGLLGDTLKTKRINYFPGLSIKFTPHTVIEDFPTAHVILEHRLRNRMSLQHSVGVVTDLISIWSVNDITDARGIKVSEELKYGLISSNTGDFVFSGAVEFFYRDFSGRQEQGTWDRRKRYGFNLKAVLSVISGRVIADIYGGIGLMKATGGEYWLEPYAFCYSCGSPNHDNTLTESATFGFRIGFIAIR